jgi:hypothetical protein
VVPKVLVYFGVPDTPALGVYGEPKRHLTLLWLKAGRLQPTPPGLNSTPWGIRSRCGHPPDLLWAHSDSYLGVPEMPIQQLV